MPLPSGRSRILASVRFKTAMRHSPSSTAPDGVVDAAVVNVAVLEFRERRSDRDLDGKNGTVCRLILSVAKVRKEWLQLIHP